MILSKSALNLCDYKPKYRNLCEFKEKLKKGGLKLLDSLKSVLHTFPCGDTPRPPQVNFVCDFSGVALGYKIPSPL